MTELRDGASGPAAPAPRPAPHPTPVPVLALALVALGAVILPIGALGARVPWTGLGPILAAPDTRELLRVTLTSAAAACVISVALGTPLALWMHNLRRGSQLARVLVLLPLAMPPVVAGLALSALLGRRGLASPLLDALGWQFAFAFPGVIAAHVFVSLPFVVITLDSALRQLDPEVLTSAAGVGISPARATARITLPAIAPALVSAAGLAAARSLGEFGTTLTFAGSLPGVTRTMPLGIYLAREIDQQLAYGLSAILAGLAILVLAATMLPPLLTRRAPTPRPRSTGEVDAVALRELTRPEADGPDVRVGATTFPAGSTTALVGPNGSGKTTLLGTVAGRFRGAPVTLGGRAVDRLPAHRRGAVMLTQNPGLPPTSTPLRAVAMVTGDVPGARALLGAAGLAELSDVPVRALSGGQAAQVALVRALAPRPRVLLLDEPLAAIDIDSAQRWRHILRATAGSRTTIVVTHDPLDVASLSDHVAVMRLGRVVALRPTAGELSAPSTVFSAQLAGLNWLPATAPAARPGEAVCAATGLGELRGTAHGGWPRDSPVAAVFSPSDVRLAPSPGPGVLRARVRAVTATAGGGFSVELEAPGGVLALSISLGDAVRLGIEPGSLLGVRVDADRVRVIPAGT